MACIKPYESKLNNFGIYCFKNGYYNQALGYFYESLKRDEDNPYVINNIAITYEALGDFKQAKKFYELAYKKSPNNKVIKENFEKYKKLKEND